MGVMAGVRVRSWLLTGVLVVVALLSLPADDAHAAILTVTTNDGGAPAVDGLCSLREAIQNATANNGANSAHPSPGFMGGQVHIGTAHVTVGSPLCFNCQPELAKDLTR